MPKVKKKNVKKKNVKKRVVKKKITPEQQSTQIDMIKTILSRQPNPLQSVDPQYRDTIQKVQHLNEMVNKEQFVLNNMKKSEEELLIRQKRIKQETNEVKQREKEYKRKEAYDKQDQKIQELKEDLQIKQDTLAGKNELGQLIKEKKDLTIKGKRLDNEIKKNPMYQKLEDAKTDVRELKARNETLERIMQTPEFQNPDKVLLMYWCRKVLKNRN